MFRKKVPQSAADYLKRTDLQNNIEQRLDSRFSTYHKGVKFLSILQNELSKYEVINLFPSSHANHHNFASKKYPQPSQEVLYPLIIWLLKKKRDSLTLPIQLNYVIDKEVPVSNGTRNRVTVQSSQNVFLFNQSLLTSSKQIFIWKKLRLW